MGVSDGMMTEANRLLAPPSEIEHIGATRLVGNLGKASASSSVPAIHSRSPLAARSYAVRMRSAILANGSGRGSGCGASSTCHAGGRLIG